MNKKNKKRVRIFTSIFFISSLLILLGFKTVDFNTSKNLDIFFSFFRELTVFYVDKADPEKLIRVGIDAMLESLDPYNEFIPEDSKEQFEFQTTGEYGGMGSIIRHSKDYPIISEVYEGSPSQKAGIMVGDTILWIDNVNVEGIAVEEVSKMLKGIPQTPISITVKRYGIPDSIVFNFNREKIHISSVPYYGIVSDSIGYIKMSGFTVDSYAEVEKALKELVTNKSARALILDLRGNPGGLLYEAVKTVNLFVEKNQLVVYTKGQIKDFDQDYKTLSRPFDERIPLVVLVDRSSASASEIVAGALQDLDRAVIIGERTFGKGLVQATRALPYNTQLKVTTAKYYIPSGRCIQAVDFSQRNDDGSISFIPDSLIHEFKTKNGRKVYDGGGIVPDILHKVIYFSRISGMLYSKNLFFNYATRFRMENSTISDSKSFRLTEKEYQNFITYINDQKFEYKSQTEEMLIDLVEVAKQEKYFSITQPLIDSLQAVIQLNRNKDLIFFKDEIKKLLEEEIVSRYYYQKGRSEFVISKDSLIPLSVEILKDMKRYNEILLKASVN